jgi:hydrogenase/urease accessory protein HupE
MRPGARALGLLLAAGAGLALAAPAAAHRLAPSLLELREGPAGRFQVTFKTPLLQAAGAELRPELPAHCAPLGPPAIETDAASATLRQAVDCGSRGLVGHTLRVAGLDASQTDALVRIELADGRTLRAVLSSDSAPLPVPAREDRREVFASYLRLGFEHILGGLDHLLFVFGLVLLVAGGRALLFTVTSFTLGHSLTLSLAVLGFVRFPTRLAELAIAASILVLATELTREPRPRPGLMRRFPWAMALLFGLLHGFGFAGALAEVGLPEGEIPLALLAFNVGIEIGQLLFVAALLLARLALGPALARAPRALSRVPAYAIGSLAAYWCFQRGAAF